MKKLVTILTLLILFTLSSFAEQPADNEPEPIITDTLDVKIDSAKTETPEEVSDKVVVYYFHGTRRCANCIKFEEYSKEAIDSGFVEELAEGRLEWRMINTDESENKHYVNDYQLYTKSLVIAKVVDGKETEWKNLDKIWKLVGAREKFKKYVKEEIRAYFQED